MYSSHTVADCCHCSESAILFCFSQCNLFIHYLYSGLVDKVVRFHWVSALDDNVGNTTGYFKRVLLHKCATLKVSCASLKVDLCNIKQEGCSQKSCCESCVWRFMTLVKVLGVSLWYVMRVCGWFWMWQMCRRAEMMRHAGADAAIGGRSPLGAKKQLAGDSRYRSTDITDMSRWVSSNVVACLTHERVGCGAWTVKIKWWLMKGHQVLDGHAITRYSTSNTPTILTFYSRASLNFP
jgi:hypothetical protein